MENALARLLAAVHDDGVVGQVSLPRDVARSRVEAADELAPVVGDLSETSRDVERRVDSEDCRSLRQELSGWFWP